MTASNYLVTGRNKQYLLHEIRDALKNATSIEIAVSFIRMSGLSLIIQDIEDAMNSEERNVKLSLLTSDYMNITEPQALKRLMLLKERGAEIQIFESKQANITKHLLRCETKSHALRPRARVARRRGAPAE